MHIFIFLQTDFDMLLMMLGHVGLVSSPKENGSKPIPRKNGTRNPSSTATISNHWNPADLRWFIFPNRPTCKNLGGTGPWRLRGSRTTINKKWKNSLHLSVSWRSSAQHKIHKKYLRSICIDMSSSPTYYCNLAIELGRLSVSKGRIWYSRPVHVIIWSYDQLRDTLKSKDVLVCQFFLDILMSRMNPPQSVCIQNIMIIDMDTYYMLPRSKNLDIYHICMWWNSKLCELILSSKWRSSKSSIWQSSFHLLHQSFRGISLFFFPEVLANSHKEFVHIYACIYIYITVCVYI